jgi:hypothetical protein
MGLGRADLLPQRPAVTTFGPCGFGEEIVLSRRGLGAMEVLPLKWVPQVPRQPLYALHPTNILRGPELFLESE